MAELGFVTEIPPADTDRIVEVLRAASSGHEGFSHWQEYSTASIFLLIDPRDRGVVMWIGRDPSAQVVCYLRLFASVHAAAVILP